MDPFLQGIHDDKARAALIEAVNGSQRGDKKSILSDAQGLFEGVRDTTVQAQFLEAITLLLKNPSASKDDTLERLKQIKESVLDREQLQQKVKQFEKVKVMFFSFGGGVSFVSGLALIVFWPVGVVMAGVGGLCLAIGSGMHIYQKKHAEKLPEEEWFKTESAKEQEALKKLLTGLKETGAPSQS